jgi:hypothetical protein
MDFLKQFFNKVLEDKNCSYLISVVCLRLLSTVITAVIIVCVMQGKNRACFSKILGKRPA